MTRAILLLSLLGAVLPTLSYLIGVRWLGRLEREPLPMLLLVVSWGAIGGTVGGLVGASLIEGAASAAFFNPRLLLDLVEFAAFVPAAEELAKGAVLIALAFTPRINHTTSGLIYGLAVGLGFAITENIIYSLHVFQTSGLSGWYVNMVVRTLFSSTVHAICSAMFGFCLGWAKIRIPGQPRYVFGSMAGFAMAFSLHGVWNALMFVGDETGDPFFSIAAFTSTPFLVSVLLFVTFLSLRAEGRIIHSELSVESAGGLLPAHHVPILASTLHPLLKRRRGWLDSGVDKSRYVALTSLLALRRRAAAPEEELSHLREAIRETLACGAHTP